MTLAARLRDAYRRFARGDPAPMAALLAEGAVYHLPGQHLGGGTLSGREAIFRRTADAARWCDEAPAIELLATAGSGTFVTSIERLRARRGDVLLDQAVTVVWRFESGHCVEMWSHFDDQAACDVFWRGFSHI